MPVFEDLVSAKTDTSYNINFKRCVGYNKINC